MSATSKRDQVIDFAKNNPGKALAMARSVSDPWFRAQELSKVTRFTDADPEPIAAKAAKEAAACEDDYKRSKAARVFDLWRLKPLRFNQRRDSFRWLVWSSSVFTFYTGTFHRRQIDRTHNEGRRWSG